MKRSNKKVKESLISQFTNKQPTHKSLYKKQPELEGNFVV